MKFIEVFKLEQKALQNLNKCFFYDVSKLVKTELSVFNSKSKYKTKNLPKHHFPHFLKKYQVEIQHVVYLYSDLFTMVIYIIRQIMENFSNSHMTRSWERNLAFVIDLSGTQKSSKHQI